MTDQNLNVNRADVSTDLLVAELLYAEFREFSFAKAAEELQLAEFFSSSDSPAKMETDNDMELTLRLVAEDVRIASDTAYARLLQQTSDTDIVNVVAGQQLAQKLAAVEKKILIDGEFAKMLQDMIDSGRDLDSLDTKDADGTLGKEVIDILLAGDRNDKGKGHGPDPLHTSDDEPSTLGKRKQIMITEDSILDAAVEDLHNAPYLNCKMCWEPFQVTASPIAATSTANTSSRIAFGMRLPCPNGHAYCIGCLSSYIQSRLDPDGNGGNSHSAVVFPIPCPECSADDRYDGLDDDVAERVLGKEALDHWYYRRVLDSLPKYYCPNSRCSALLLAPEDQDTVQAICPSCQTLICVPCCSIWHVDISCEEYQLMPIDDRTPEDIQALNLAKAQKWRRCPSCSMLVELRQGCYHIVCRCRTQFCFRCGSAWSVKQTRCSSDPPCQLWDDETMLLNERERERERLLRLRPRTIPGRR